MYGDSAKQHVKRDIAVAKPETTRMNPRQRPSARASDALIFIAVAGFLAFSYSAFAWGVGVITFLVLPSRACVVKVFIIFVCILPTRAAPCPPVHGLPQGSVVASSAFR